jgi:hypothetical protein
VSTTIITTKPPLTKGPQDYHSIRTAAEIVSLAFASDPLIRWISRDRTGPGWESLPPTLQLWQEARLRGYAVRAIAMEAVTSDKSQPVGSCFLFPPSPKSRWLNPLWWPAYLRVLWDEWWVQPNETLGDAKVRINPTHLYDETVTDKALED